MHKDDCKNCGEETHVPDGLTGLIHLNGLYACYPKAKVTEKRYSMVAETE